MVCDDSEPSGIDAPTRRISYLDSKRCNMHDTTRVVGVENTVLWCWEELVSDGCWRWLHGNAMAAMEEQIEG